MSRLISALALPGVLATSAAQAQASLPTGWVEGTPWWIPTSLAVAVALMAALGAIGLRGRL